MPSETLLRNARFQIDHGDPLDLSGLIDRHLELFGEPMDLGDMVAVCGLEIGGSAALSVCAVSRVEDAERSPATSAPFSAASLPRGGW